MLSSVVQPASSATSTTLRSIEHDEHDAAPQEGLLQRLELEPHHGEAERGASGIVETDSHRRGVLINYGFMVGKLSGRTLRRHPTDRCLHL